MQYGSTHTLQQKTVLATAAFSFLILFFFSFYLENPIIKQPKMKHERVLKDETPRSESTQTLPGKEQRTSMNSMDANDRTKPKPEDV